MPITQPVCSPISRRARQQVTPETEEIPPGMSQRVWVETDDPPAGVGGFFTLEVSGADGRLLRVGNVALAPRTQEGKR